MLTMDRPNQNASLIEVSPEIARTILKKNHNFRDIKKGKVEQLARVFQNGHYRCDGSPIRMDCNGNLIDGQHRLEAIARAGVTVWVWCISGIESDTTIDTMLTPRSLKDHLSHIGHKSACSLAGTLNTILIMKEYQQTAVSSVRRGLRPGVQECLDYLAEYPSVIESCRKAQHVTYGRQSLVATIHHLASLQNLDIADLFIAELGSTANKGVHDPIRAFQSKMIANSKSKAKMIDSDKDALLIKAWNFWITGQSCSTLRFTSVGPSAEMFPTMIMPNDPEVTRIS